MKPVSIIFCLLLGCSIALIIVFKNLSGPAQIKNAAATVSSEGGFNKPAQFINEIPLPEGYKRIRAEPGSFAAWLRNIKLRKDNTVYLYNGNPKPNQTLHYAVLDFSTGNKDLQQCADAIMRLRAEYYFAKQQYKKISFKSADKLYNFENYAQQHNKCYTHDCLLKFLEQVYAYCGTYTVDAMTKQIAMKEMQPGDVCIKAGSPGHAMIIIDVAIHETTGKKIYLLAQSFMPAQDMHIVINSDDDGLSPWYEVNEDEIITPGWVFKPQQLKRYTQ